MSDEEDYKTRSIRIQQALQKRELARHKLITDNIAEGKWPQNKDDGGDSEHPASL